MIAGCDKFDGGCSVGVAGGEGEGELVPESIVHRPLTSDHGGNPVEEIVSIWECCHCGITCHLYMNKEGIQYVIIGVLLR